MSEQWSEPNFVLRESQDDPVLLDLLAEREVLIDRIGQSGRRDPAVLSQYHTLGFDIQQYKTRNNIPVQPPLTPEDAAALESWVEESNT